MGMGDGYEVLDNLQPTTYQPTTYQPTTYHLPPPTTPTTYHLSVTCHP